VSGAGNQQERLSRQEARRWFIAGVVEGEGSVHVSIKRHPTSAFGYFVQPEFLIYQHRDRRSLLEMALDEFGAGAISPKPGNPAVLVFRIGNRQVLRDSVIPFLRSYMCFSARVATMNASPR
jgi:LAGLIDADG endonuclease